MYVKGYVFSNIQYVCVCVCVYVCVRVGMCVGHWTVSAVVRVTSVH